MSNPASDHHAFLRRAVMPNLFTATLHPEFLPALVIANLMTPRLWEWARTAVSPSSPPDVALREIHHFLNKRFFHATGKAFAAMWGLQENRHLTDTAERDASDYAMRLIARGGLMKGEEIPWLLPLVPLLGDGLFPLFVYSTVDALRALGHRFGKRSLGVTCCLDECVLAASLALAAGVCRWEDIVFVGSPMHYTVFFLTSRGTVWFNARREFFTEAAWNEICQGKGDGPILEEVNNRVLIADRLICGSGAAVIPTGSLSGNRDAILNAGKEVERFAGAPLPWLNPLPAQDGDHAFAGWEAIPSALEAGGAAAVQYAVLERARKGGARLLDAALYMYRHPEVCDAEILKAAAKGNFYAYLKANSATLPRDILAMVDAIPGRESIYGNTGRLAQPDEILAFGTASTAERELLHAVMHEHFLTREAASGSCEKLH